MKLYCITENDSNIRLDKFLRKLFPNATRWLLFKINRKEKVKVKSLENDKFTRKDNEYKLQIWDEIKLFLSDNDIKELSENKEESKKVDENQKFDKKNIVYEDADLFVVNKDFWVNVHPWDFKTTEISLISQVQDYLWEKLNSLTFKPSLIHRIDRDTSWILMIAKKKDILTKLVEDFKNHKKIQKTYLAIVFWNTPHKSGTINKKLLRIEWAKKEDKVQISENWQTAISHYKVISEHLAKTKNWDQKISVLEVKIETWRMHQIRVHLASLWTPIIWDDKYWDKSLNHYFKKEFWVARQMLHAYKIKFFHYSRNKEIELEARLKDDMSNFLKKLK